MVNLGLRHPLTHRESSCPAAVARARLLNDRIMRRSTPPAAVPVPTARRSQDRLSAAIQRQHALNIARSFEHHYLAGIRFDPDTHTTVAIIRPVRQKSASRERAHSIRIDAYGEVLVSPLPVPMSARWHRVASVAALIVLFAAILCVTFVCVA
jgi:hypothetical protein